MTLDSSAITIRASLEIPDDLCLPDLSADRRAVEESPVGSTGERVGGRGHTRSPAKVLLLPKTSFSNTFREVTHILVANRIKYKATVAGKSLPDLIKISKGLGKYGVVFFEDHRSYLNMDSWNRDLLDKYCKMFNVSRLLRNTARMIISFKWHIFCFRWGLSHSSPWTSLRTRTGNCSIQSTKDSSPSLFVRKQS